jgi:hypothetical protein
MTESATLESLPELSSCRVSNSALSGAELPGRIKILNWGVNESTKGAFRVGEQTAAVLEANQRALGYERVAIDFNHASVPGSEDYEKGKPPAIFGYGRVKVLRGDGVWLEDIVWTPMGREHARNYEDLSPAIHVAPGEEGEVDFVHSVALTPNGALRDVTFFSATKTMTMSDKANMPANGQVVTLAALAGALGLGAEAGEAAVMERVRHLGALEGRIKELEALKGGNAPDVTALTGRLAELEKMVKASAEAAEKAEREKIIQLFTAEGKVPKGADGKELSAEELGKMSLETLRMLRANTPSTVPLHARGKRPGAGDGELKGLARVAAAFARQVAGQV